MAGVKALFSSDKLQASCENTCFVALRSWVDDADGRDKHYEDLLGTLRMPHMHVNFLSDVVKVRAG